MDREAYVMMASHEADHWWFVGRRAVIGAVLDGVTIPASARILEAGCGTGGNLYLLEERGIVSAFDPHEAALEIAKERHPGVAIHPGELPTALPFETGSFDLVAALDVLEHVQDDAGALDALISMARPGGHILLSVPTHPLLFGSHDRRLHHVRRYGVSAFRQMVDRPDAELVYFGAYNTILAPVAFTLRLAEKILPLNFGNQERKPPALINAALSVAFSSEAVVARRIPLPIGLSQIALLRRHA